MIIVDDGSTDSSVDIIKGKIKSANYNIQLLKQENSGPGAARNMGIEQSSGDIIVFIDSDFEADSRWLETIINS